MTTVTSWITARRRRHAAGYGAILLALVAIGGIYAAVTGIGGGGSAAASTTASTQQIAAGKNLFDVTCASCHGLDAQGTAHVAPSLIGAGAAAVDFQMSTGRMPAKEIGAEPTEQTPRYTPQQIYDIAAYIQSLGGGPAIPSAQQVSTKNANYSVGEQLYNANCAQCHNFSGAGGALTGGMYAPSLSRATNRQIYEAMQTGPYTMPVFNDSTITPQEKRDVIAYITTVRSEPNPGGFSLGRLGPTTEGLVAWFGGLGALILAAMWITAKRRGERTGRGGRSGEVSGTQ